jgi:hypothetical protein
LIDCNVTGSDTGTSDKPKFALLHLFRDRIFTQIQKLSGPGGRYEGYVPIIQGDNAGPQEDGTLKQSVRDYCSDNERHWEHAAPQQP